MSNRIVFDPLEGKAVAQPKEVYCKSELNRVLRTNGVVSYAIPRNLESKATLPEITFPSDCKIGRVGQVAESVGIAADTRIEKALELLAEEREILENPNCTVDERSFLLQVNQLVAEMLHLLSELSNRDRTKADFSKKEYNVFNSKVAEYTKDQGSCGALFSGLALAISLVTAPFGDVASKIGSAFASQSQPLSNWWSSGYAAESGKYSNKINLISTDLQASSSKSSDNSAWKNELIQALSEAKECLKAAVRSNG